MNFSMDIWEYLKGAEKTVVMYGMGNGADKILCVCERYGIDVADFFASDGFVRGHLFHGKRVLSFCEVKEKYGAENIIVLLSFATSLPEVIDNIKKIASECELYAPDVPVCGEELFTLSYARQHRHELQEVYDLLSDEESKRIFENTVKYKLSGKLDCLFLAESDKCEAYNSLLHAEAIESYADLGAYNGDTVRELMEYSKKLSRVYAFEPDRRSFRKLGTWAESVTGLDIRTVNAAAWDCDTTLVFGDEGNRNSGLFARGKTAEVQATTLDAVLAGEAVDYIKYDVEGCEREAILGSRGAILAHRPRLLVSAYHRTEDIFALPLMIHELFPDYRLYLRRYPYIPAWDLNLICI